MRRANRLRAFVASPVPYATWALLVPAALLATYFVDPYVFAFATFILGGATGVVALVGLPTTLLAREGSRRRRVVIVVSVGAAVAAVLVALALLRTFHWA